MKLELFFIEKTKGGLMKFGLADTSIFGAKAGQIEKFWKIYLPAGNYPKTISLEIPSKEKVKSEVNFEEMTKKELKVFVKKQGLSVDDDDYDNTEEFRRAVKKAMRGSKKSEPKPKEEKKKNCERCRLYGDADCPKFSKTHTPRGKVKESWGMEYADDCASYKGKRGRLPGKTEEKEEKPVPKPVTCDLCRFYGDKDECYFYDKTHTKGRVDKSYDLEDVCEVFEATTTKPRKS